MKTKNIILGLSFILLFLTSCSKNDDDIAINEVPQYPMKTLIESGHMNVTYQKVNGVNTFELGYKFKSFKNGTITGLGVRAPSNETYRVTLRNVETEEIIITTDVISTSGLVSFQDINAVNIVSGVEYFVSVNTNDYYQFSNEGNTLFPVESEDILIAGYGSYYGTAQALPQTFSNTSYLGMVDIKFVPNN